jgi:hypothetical protein
MKKVNDFISFLLIVFILRGVLGSRMEKDRGGIYAIRVVRSGSTSCLQREIGVGLRF